MGHRLTAALALAQLPAAGWAQQAPAQDEPALCTDRPTKSNSVCTTPAGTIQVETDITNWSRLNDGGVRIDTIQAPVPTIKLGLGGNTDVQATFAPYVRVTNRAGGSSDHLTGVGDLTLRIKQRFTDPVAKLQVGMIPFVKVPTARRGIGNREWESGVALPVQYGLPAGMTVTFGPEIDLLHDADGCGSHLQYVGTANLGKAVSSTARSTVSSGLRRMTIRTVRWHNIPPTLRSLGSLGPNCNSISAATSA